MGKTERKHLKRWIWFVAVVVLTWPTGVVAHGGGTPQLTDVAAGPYKLYVWSSPEPPRVGDMHVTIAVVETREVEAAVEEPVMDADVRVLMTPLDKPDEAFTLPATNQATLLQRYYEGDFPIPFAGMWQVSVEVSGPEGAGSASFDVEALPARRVNWQTVLVIAGVLLMGMGLYGRRRQRPKREKLFYR